MHCHGHSSSPFLVVRLSTGLSRFESISQQAPTTLDVCPSLRELLGQSGSRHRATQPVRVTAPRCAANPGHGTALLGQSGSWHRAARPVRVTAPCSSTRPGHDTALLSQAVCYWGRAECRPSRSAGHWLVSARPDSHGCGHTDLTRRSRMVLSLRARVNCYSGTRLGKAPPAPRSGPICRQRYGPNSPGIKHTHRVRALNSRPLVTP